MHRRCEEVVVCERDVAMGGYPRGGACVMCSQFPAKDSVEKPSVRALLERFIPAKPCRLSQHMQAGR